MKAECVRDDECKVAKNTVLQIASLTSVVHLCFVGMLNISWQKDSVEHVKASPSFKDEEQFCRTGGQGKGQFSFGVHLEFLSGSLVKSVGKEDEARDKHWQTC